MERRKRPRENLGDTTQLMPSLVSPQANSSGNANGLAPRDGWWNTQRFLLFAAIPAMIVTFAAVVVLSKTKQPASPSTTSTQIVAAPPAANPIPEPTPQTSAATQPVAPIATTSDSPKVASDAKNAVNPADKKLALNQTIEKAKTKNEKAKLDSLKKSETGVSKFSAKGDASVTLAVSPWGEVFIDGKRLGVTPPLRDLTLPSGKHTILIVNATFNPYSKTIDLAPGSTHKIKYKFQN